MMKFFKKLIYSFSEQAAFEREQCAMQAFLSQATDLYHLEHLEREWNRMRIRNFSY